MTQAYKVVIERDTQGGYTATFPEVVNCQAQAGSRKMLIERIREEVALCPEAGEPAAARQSSMPHRESKSWTHHLQRR